MRFSVTVGWTTEGVVVAGGVTVTGAELTGSATSGTGVGVGAGVVVVSGVCSSDFSETGAFLISPTLASSSEDLVSDTSCCDLLSSFSSSACGSGR